MNTAAEETHERTHEAPAITVTVNERPVVFQERKATGLEIKQTAINQGVPVQLDFALFRVNPGGQLKQIADNEQVPLHEGEAFRAVAPDDNS